MFPARTFAKKKVGVFGLARSGTACAEALRLGGAEVFAWDDQPQSVEKAKQDGLPIGDLKAMDFATLDSLILSPGVPLTHPKPHWTVEKAKAAGIEIIGDTEVFQRELKGTGAACAGRIARAQVKAFRQGRNTALIENLIRSFTTSPLGE